MSVRYIIKSVVIVVGVLIFIGLSGCLENSDKDKFIGTWHSSSEIMTFVSDGTLIGTHGETGTWKLDGGKLIFSFYLSSFVMSYSFPDDKTLDLNGQIWEKVD
jgi:hypothetical protein